MAAIDHSDPNVFVVERVLDTRICRRRRMFLVKWKNFPDTENTWEPAENLDHCHDILTEFLSRNQPTSRPNRRRAPPVSPKPKTEPPVSPIPTADAPPDDDGDVVVLGKFARRI
jgi:chromobox protein 5